jgi:hypothetical protein
MKEGATATGGIGFTGLLQILFIGLKLTGYIDWSWFWVLAPLWISIIVGIAFFIGFLVFIIVMAIRTDAAEEKRFQNLKRKGIDNRFHL